MQNDAQTLDTLQTPCLLLDEARLRANVDRMKAHLAGLGVGFRPHLKTAKSLDVARIAMTNPEDPAMVSTLREAEYFAEGGVRDVLTRMQLENLYGAPVEMLTDSASGATAFLPG